VSIQAISKYSPQYIYNAAKPGSSAAPNLSATQIIPRTALSVSRSLGGRNAAPELDVSDLNTALGEFPRPDTCVSYRTILSYFLNRGMQQATELRDDNAAGSKAEKTRPNASSWQLLHGARRQAPRIQDVKARCRLGAALPSENVLRGDECAVLIHGFVAISYSGDQIKNDMRCGMWQVWDRRMQRLAGETWKNNSETVYGRITLNCIFNE
jgi:hypothetical protein